ncbi:MULTISPECIES: fibronectin type III domain-containing protein [Pseudoalteromonas]|uniref:fibronectin type III domain-containing protein n=1 Tax=Pseudoalteromonas TaxID=53246 RepID=UPI000F7B1C9A|nr:MULTISPECIES: fibronectin type III domain-containing protein [Pseudoalteromonas]MCG7560706.1 fibronectin type III domain-containing protein [Pseudoalteromonas sp. McH1-42]
MSRYFKYRSMMSCAGLILASGPVLAVSLQMPSLVEYVLNDDPPYQSGSLWLPPVSQSDTVRLGWQIDAQAERFVLQQSNNGGVSWQTVYEGTEQDIELGGYTNGVYYFRVQACASGACTGYVKSAPLKVAIPEAGPQSVVATKQGEEVNVAWQPRSSAPATQYRVYESLNGEEYQMVSATVQPRIQLQQAKVATTRYKVKACTDGLTCSRFSPASNEVGGLPAPENLSAVDKGAQGVQLSWQSVGTDTQDVYYQIDFSLNYSNWVVLANSTEPSYLMQPVPEGKIKFRVRACDKTSCYEVSQATNQISRFSSQACLDSTKGLNVFATNDGYYLRRQLAYTSSKILPGKVLIPYASQSHNSAAYWFVSKNSRDQWQLSNSDHQQFNNAKKQQSNMLVTCHLDPRSQRPTLQLKTIGSTQSIDLQADLLKGEDNSEQYFFFPSVVHIGQAADIRWQIPQGTECRYEELLFVGRGAGEFVAVKARNEGIEFICSSQGSAWPYLVPVQVQKLGAPKFVSPVRN